MKEVHITQKTDIQEVQYCPGFMAKGDPRVNIQNRKGYSKAYHVRQVLKAIERLEIEDAKE